MESHPESSLHPSCILNLWWDDKDGAFLFIPLNYLYPCSSSAMTLIIFTSSAVRISFVEAFHQLCFWFEAQRVAAWRSWCLLFWLLQTSVQTSPGVLQESLCLSRICTWSSLLCVHVGIKIAVLCFPALTLGDCVWVKDQDRVWSRVQFVVLFCAESFNMLISVWQWFGCWLASGHPIAVESFGWFG